MSAPPVSPTPERLRKPLAASDERRVALWAGVTLFLVGWAAVSVTNAAETFFLKRVGIERLPVIFLVNSVLLALTTFWISRFAARGRPGASVTRVLAAIGGSLVVLGILREMGVPGVLGVLVIAAKQSQAVALVVFWVALGGWFDGRQAKRLVPPVMAGGTLGSLTGSFASGPLGQLLGINALVPLAGLAMIGAAIASLPMRAAAPTRIATAQRQSAPPRPPFSELWRDSGLFRLLATSTLLGGILAPVLYYQFSVAADAATPGANAEQDLLQLYAQVRGWLHGAVLVLQLLGTSWLFQRVGVPLASSLSPLVYLCGFAAMAGLPGLAASILAVAGATLQDHALHDPAERTLTTLIPERLRPTATGLIEGPIKRLAGALGNVLILAAIATGVAHWLPWMALPVAVAWLAVALLLWRVYPSLLLEVSAEDRPRGATLPLDELLDARTRRVLQEAYRSGQLQVCRAACTLVAESGDGTALPGLVTAVGEAPEANRGTLIETMERLARREGLPADLCERVAVQLEPAVANAPALPADQQPPLLRTYGMLRRQAGQSVPDHLTAGRAQLGPAARLTLDLITDEDGHEAALRRSYAGSETERRSATDELRALLLDPTQPPERFEARLGLLASRLSQPGECEHTAAALAEIAAAHGPAVEPVVDIVLEKLDAPSVDVRVAVLHFAGAARAGRTATRLVESLAASEAEVVEAAQEALRELGGDAVERILAKAHLAKRRVRTALVPVLRDLPVAPQTLEVLLEQEASQLRRTVLLADVLRGGPVHAIVLQRLRERADEGVCVGLTLVATLVSDERVAQLGSVLDRTPPGRGRAVIAEALETLLPPRHAQALVPYIDERGRTKAATGDARRHHEEPPSYDEAVVQLLTDEDSLTRAFAAGTLPAEIVDRGGGMRPFTRDDLVVALWGPQGRVPEATAMVEPRPGSTERPMTGVEIVLHLRSLSLFDRLETRQLSELAGIVKRAHHAAGSTIVREGEFDDCMYIIIDGRVRITKGEHQLAELGAREFFGEMAMFDGETRSATVTAEIQTETLRIERSDLLHVMDDHPGIAITMLQTLTRRVRDLNEELRDLRTRDDADPQNK